MRMPGRQSLLHLFLGSPAARFPGWTKEDCDPGAHWNLFDFTEGKSVGSGLNQNVLRCSDH